MNHDLYIRGLLQEVKRCGMTIMNHHVQYFGAQNNSGYSLIIILAESHISFHTFPEDFQGNKNSIDIYTCSISKDNSEGCKKLYKYIKETFKPQEIKGEMFLNRY